MPSELPLLPLGDLLRSRYPQPAPAPRAPQIRPLTTTDRINDYARWIYEQAAAQPLGKVADLIGLSDLAGMARSIGAPPTVSAGVISPFKKMPLKGVRKEDLLREVEQLHADLGHPWGDRDDFAGFIDTDPEDLSEMSIRSVLKELQALAKRRAPR